MAKYSRSIKLIAVGLVLIGIAAAAFIYIQYHYDPYKPTGAEFYKKYTNPKDKDKCIAEWYRLHPELRPENRKPNEFYLGPPCPGVPQ